MPYFLVLAGVVFLSGVLVGDERTDVIVNDGRGAMETQDEAGVGAITSTDARSRIEELGYTDVSELRQDRQGVWRGRAKRDGQVFAVWVDPEGNTFSQ